MRRSAQVSPPLSSVFALLCSAGRVASNVCSVFHTQLAKQINFAPNSFHKYPHLEKAQQGKKYHQIIFLIFSDVWVMARLWWTRSAPPPRCRRRCAFSSAWGCSVLQPPSVCTVLCTVYCVLLYCSALLNVYCSYALPFLFIIITIQ